MDNFPQVRDAEFWHDTSAFREIGKPFNMGNNFLKKSIAHIRRLLIFIPGKDGFQIIKSRGSKK